MSISDKVEERAQKHWLNVFLWKPDCAFIEKRKNGQMFWIQEYNSWHPATLKSRPNRLNGYYKWSSKRKQWFRITKKEYMAH